MSDSKFLLYLHGVSTSKTHDSGPSEAWKTALFAELEELGFRNLDSFRVIEPSYTDLLHSNDAKADVPPTTTKRLGKVEAEDHLRAYQERVSALEVKWGYSYEGPGMAYQDSLVSAVKNFGAFRQAKSYVEDDNVRAQVLNKILDSLPDEGRLVIVGHSLGSVIAADLVTRISPKVQVEGMVTIGSPLGTSYFSGKKLTKELVNSPQNLGWWVNLWGTGDPVAASRGISAKIEWVLDLPVKTGWKPVPAHSSKNYLSNPNVANLIGTALLGPLCREIVPVDSGVDVPFDQAEWLAVAALRYVYLVECQLKENSKSKKDKETLERYSGARILVQSRAITELIERRKTEAKPIPSELIRMSIELAEEGKKTAPEPTQLTRLSREDAVEIVPRLLTENLINPYEISIREEIRKEAAKDLSAELGLRSTFGVQALESIQLVQEELRGGSNALGNGLILGAAGLGAVAMVVATGGLALAAAPGAFGAAAVTSALAAFGPGGMIGGLFSSGALLSAGSGTLALSLSNTRASAAVVEEMLVLPLVEAELRKKLKLEANPSIWFEIVEAEMNVRREYQQLVPFCDHKSAALKGLKSKLTSIVRALDFLRALGLEPGVEKSEAKKAPKKAAKKTAKDADAKAERRAVGQRKVPKLELAAGTSK
ncbi:hypothetical protein [Corynebacterium flavescens]|uniref:hypothetical protein n=1 Tax=Corynebacterium flavescens TaxID=28028 RepID=UPI003FCEF2F3